ncbi:MAG: methyltransferase domain-containing protein [Candidatus Cloacimonetes bacterium]|nr:methyltransferase domain-containing protein [Candidatus Cloacimonadota bacterium]
MENRGYENSISDTPVIYTELNALQNNLDNEEKQENIALIQNYCPICKNTSIFEPFGNPTREHSQCPYCKSKERHRALWLYFEKKTDLFSNPNNAILHFAAEKYFSEPLQKLNGNRYITADLYNPKAMIRMDITDIKFNDESFDVFMCNHVLEHIPDDIKAMSEIHRILKIGGVAYITIQYYDIDKTYEDFSITDPERRKKAFGQHDHIRKYGRDFANRLESGGFEVDEVSPESYATNYEITKQGIKDEFASTSTKNHEYHRNDNFTTNIIFTAKKVCQDRNKASIEKSNKKSYQITANTNNNIEFGAGFSSGKTFIEKITITNNNDFPVNDIIPEINRKTPLLKGWDLYPGEILEIDFLSGIMGVENYAQIMSVTQKINLATRESKTLESCYAIKKIINKTKPGVILVPSDNIIYKLEYDDSKVSLPEDIFISYQDIYTTIPSIKNQSNILTIMTKNDSDLDIQISLKNQKNDLPEHIKSQVNDDHKQEAFLTYFNEKRWSSLYSQIKEILTINPKSILDIGVAYKVVSAIINNLPDITYKTLDYSVSFNPDYVASVTNMPISDNEFDVVCAFQVLEHLPFDEFRYALSEMMRVAKKRVLISLPHSSGTHTFNGEHYWEIGKVGYEESWVLDYINKIAKLNGYTLISEYLQKDNTYHHFFIFENNSDGALWDLKEKLDQESRAIYKKYYPQKYTFAQLKAARNEKKMLIFWADAIHNFGGLADRLRGIITCYQFTKSLDVDFKISFIHPNNLINYLRPNEVDWEINPESIIFDSKISLFMPLSGRDTAVRNPIIELQYLFKYYQQIVMPTNRPPNQELFSEDFHKLFKLSPVLKSEVDKNISLIGGLGYISATFRFQNLLGDFYEGPTRVTMPTEERPALIQKCLEQLTLIYRKCYPNKSNKILVCSDSLTFLEIVSKLDYVYTIPGNLAHLKYNDDFDGSIMLKSFTDFFMLSNSNCLYDVVIDKMYKGGFTQKASLINQKPYQLIRL